MRAGLLIALTLTGCGAPVLEPPAAPSQTAASNRIESHATGAIDPLRCRAGHPDVHPFVVTWDATEQSELTAHASQSLVVMKLADCGAEVMPACLLPGEYPLRETAGNVQSLTLSSDDELYANLPLGVAALSGHLAKSGSISVKYFVRGTRTASAPKLYRSQLGPGCEGATHFVLNFAVGAFDVESNRALGAGAEASGFGAGAKGQHNDNSGAHFLGGTLATCEQNEGCDAPVRLRLLPITEGSPPADQAAVAQLATVAPVAVAKPPTREEATLALTAARLQIRDGLASCLDEFPPDWSKQTVSRLKGSVTFCNDGSVCAVTMDPATTLGPEGAACGKTALFSARVPGFGNPGGPKAIAAALTMSLTADPPQCARGTRVDGWKC